MSLSTPGVQLQSSKDLRNRQEWESKFTLTLNTAKNIDYIEKCFEQKLSILKFPVKN